MYFYCACEEALRTLLLPDVVSHSASISTCVELLRTSLTPDVVSHNAAISMCEEVLRASFLPDVVSHDRLFTPDVATYNTGSNLR